MIHLTAPRAASFAGLLLAAGASFGASETVMAQQAAPVAGGARIADLTYEVYLGGLHIFSFEVDMRLGPDAYRVDAEGGTRGLIGWLYKWDMKLAAEGAARNGSVVPLRYHTETDWQRNPRTMYLAFGSGGDYDVSYDPPREQELDPDIEGALPDKLPANAVDPLSLAVAATRALADSGRCDQTLPVFDGQRRFDLTVKHLDETVLAPNRYSIYQGPAVRCTFTMERISGFRKSWRERGRQWDEDAQSPPTVWVAPVRPELPPLPVRYEGAIALGNMVVHLTKADVRIESAENTPATLPAK